MLEYEDFEKYMLEIKNQQEKEHALDNALHNMSPDFGGFSSETLDLIVELLKRLMLDEEDWIGYYIWESEWGTKHPYVWDEDDKEIPLQTLKDLYNIIVEGNRNEKSNSTND